MTCITMQNCIESVPMENITDILAELRKSHSQSELSRLTGISQSKLSRWEAGQVADGADDALKLLALAKRTTPTPQETNGEVA